MNGLIVEQTFTMYIPKLHFHKNSFCFTPSRASKGILKQLNEKMGYTQVSYTFRSTEGANHHARIAGFTSTLRKQNINVFSTIMDVFDGKEITFAQ